MDNQNSNDETYKYAVYRGWNMYLLPLTGNKISVAATRYGLCYTRSPIVHQSFIASSDKDDLSKEVAEVKVRAMIDEIENEGFYSYVARNSPQAAHSLQASIAVEEKADE